MMMYRKSLCHKILREVGEDLNERYSTNSIEDLVNKMPQYDAIIFDSLTRFGNIALMKALWAKTSNFTGAASIRGCEENAVGVCHSRHKLTER
jgi:multimeric flavodoxin WrbA